MNDIVGRFLWRVKVKINEPFPKAGRVDLLVTTPKGKGSIYHAEIAAKGILNTYPEAVLLTTEYLGTIDC